MEPTINYSVKSITWNSEHPDVVLIILCEITAMIGDQKFSQEFTSTLEFIDPTDPNFIDIRDMINSDRIEDAKPILLEFAKAQWNKDAYDQQIIDQNNIDYDRVEKIVQALTDFGVDPIEVEKQKQSLLNPEAITLDKFEKRMINQLQNMIEDDDLKNDKSELVTTL